MNSVRVDKKNVIDILRKNRNKHVTIFADSYKKYRENCISYLERKLEQAKRNGRIKMYDEEILEEPRCYLKAYDLAIEMLEMSLDDTLELSEGDFRRYVKDEWDWSRDFYISNSSSSSSSSSGSSVIEDDVALYFSETK